MSSWYGGFQWTRFFWPLSLLFSYVVKNKREQYLKKDKVHNTKPVVVVGNITVGGTGKTPLVQALVTFLQKNGYRPGIISRGYGAQIKEFPHLISSSDTCSDVGDEPFMLAKSLNVPVVIDPKRRCALEFISELDVDVVLSDDGMQHYDLPRDLEICVLDGHRLLGNGQLMPVGPLREPVSRLKEVDMVVHSGKSGGDDWFEFVPVCWVNVKTGTALALNKLRIEEGALAIAGIGNPQKFEKTLQSLSIYCPLKAFPDHYLYESSDFLEMKGQVLMTHKDAVKIQSFAHDNMWFLKIEAGLSSAFLENFLQKLKNCSEN